MGASLRNLAFNTGILSSRKFDIPVICVGNLSVGGTGKSPHVIMLLDLLKGYYDTAVLSRGYGRRTKGLKIANYNSRVYDVGDEPLQFFNRFKNGIVVAVSEDRAAGIEYLKKAFKTRLVVMDDGFQHRHVKPGFSVLLTDFHHLYTSDYLLPAGNLREPRSGARRADVIIVTKCPDEFTVKKKNEILKKIRPRKHQKVYFSKVVYSESAIGYRFTIHEDEWFEYDAVVVTGIANPQPFLDYVRPKFKSIVHMNYPDHHNFSVAEVEEIDRVFEGVENPHKIILTTEKDYMRLKDESALIENLFYLPIEVQLDDYDDFREKILNYAEKN